MTSATALRAYNSMFLSDDNFMPSNALHASYGTALREFVEPIPRELIGTIKRAAQERISAPLQREHSVFFDEAGISASVQCVHSVSSAIDAKNSTALQMFNAIQDLYLSQNPRDRQIAERLKCLYRDALEEGEKMRTDSIDQFCKFFLDNRDVGVPKITLTPDGTLRARWIHGAGNFIAIEFTGKPLARVVAEMPRNNETAIYFFSESIENIVLNARAVGASFA